VYCSHRLVLLSERSVIFMIVNVSVNAFKSSSELPAYPVPETPAMVYDLLLALMERNEFESQLRTELRGDPGL